jgi:hypothetical protein
MPILEDFTGVKQDLQAAINNPVAVAPVRLALRPGRRLPIGCALAVPGQAPAAAPGVAGPH